MFHAGYPWDARLKGQAYRSGKKLLSISLLVDDRSDIAIFVNCNFVTFVFETALRHPQSWHTQHRRGICRPYIQHLHAHRRNRRQDEQPNLVAVARRDLTRQFRPVRIKHAYKFRSANRQTHRGVDNILPFDRKRVVHGQRNALNPRIHRAHQRADRTLEDR